MPPSSSTPTMKRHYFRMPMPLFVSPSLESRVEEKNVGNRTTPYESTVCGLITWAIRYCNCRTHSSTLMRVLKPSLSAHEKRYRYTCICIVPALKRRGSIIYCDRYCDRTASGKGRWCMHACVRGSHTHTAVVLQVRDEVNLHFE